MNDIFSHKKILLLLFIPILCAHSHAQQNNANSPPTISDILQFTNDNYGVDQQFLNGRFYEYKYKHALGHPFFQENEFTEGNLTLRGKLYQGISMKFDLYSQDLILFSIVDQQQLTFCPPAEFVNSFTIYGKNFERRSSIYETPAYFQVVAEEEQISCLYYWFKTRQESDHEQRFSSYKFDASKRKNYLIINKEIFQYSTNRTFKKSFPQKIQKMISSYMKSKKIRMKTVSDIEMKELIKYSQTSLYGQE